MPFRSNKQRRACFATNGFNGAIDCHEWAHAKKNMGGEHMKKYRGSCMKCGGKKMKYQPGGISGYPEDQLFLPQNAQNVSDNGQWSAVDTGQESPDYTWSGIRNTPRRPLIKTDFSVGVPALTAGLGWLSSIMERNRQNKYMYDQFTAMGQQKPVASEDYQPSPYSLYARYGGSLRKWAEGGGLSRERNYGSEKKPYPSVAASEFAGPHRSYPIPTHADAVDAMRLAHLHGAESVIRNIHRKYPDLLHGGNPAMAPYHDLPRDEYDAMYKQMYENQQNVPEGYHLMPDGSLMSDKEMQGYMAKGGKWIQGAINPKHKGYCTPMTKKTCTPRRKALAMTFKKHHGFHD